MSTFDMFQGNPLNTEVTFARPDEDKVSVLLEPAGVVLVWVWDLRSPAELYHFNKATLSPGVCFKGGENDSLNL